MKLDLDNEEYFPCLECDGSGIADFEDDGEDPCPACDGTGEGDA